MQKVLIIVDMQNDFLNGGKEKLILPVYEKIKRRKAEGYEVLFTADEHGGGSFGEAFAAKIAEEARGCRIFKKRSYGCGKLIEYLSAIKPVSVEFAGVCTDICVITNVLAAKAFLPESEIIVDGGCCAGKTEEGHFAAIAVMKSCGVTVI